MKLNSEAARCKNDTEIKNELLVENWALKNEVKGLEAIAKQERERADRYKAFFDDVANKPDCNTCMDKECVYRPKPGEITRFNCQLWKGAIDR